MKVERLPLYIFAFLLAMTGLGLPLSADPSARIGRLNLMDGPVSFRSGSLDEWSPASLNYPVTLGDSLWAGQESRAEIHVGSSAIRLAPTTDISFLNLDDQTVQIQLLGGSLDIRLRHLSKGEAFEVDTPNASVSLVAAGTYRVDIRGDGDTLVTVRLGETEVTAGLEAFAVVAGQSALVPQANPAGYSVQAAAATDDWESWCAARDGIEDHIASTQYVPVDVVGVEDLDQYGTWSATADYGPVWQPRGVDVDWAPYSDGDWAWVEPWGWTWIDRSPWGFAPFHYGRWAHMNTGWGWIPGRFEPHRRPIYAPALVVFVGGDKWRPSGIAGGGVGWFPLGPREVYVPPYQANGAYVRNINSSAVPNVGAVDFNHLRTDYANRNVPGAMRAIPSQSFGRQQSAPGRAFSVSGGDVAGAPMMGMTAAIAPQRESIVAPSMLPAKGATARPPEQTEARSVVARLTPPPAPLPFAARQQALAANKGRPLGQAAMRIIAKASPQRHPGKVRVVNRNQIKKVKPRVVQQQQSNR
jgi:hypothetical protein